MKIRAIVLSFLIVAPGVALAADAREAVRAACGADMKAHCSTAFSRTKAIGCLADNAARLSETCTAALKVASCNDKAPDNLKAAFPCAN